MIQTQDQSDSITGIPGNVGKLLIARDVDPRPATIKLMTTLS